MEDISKKLILTPEQCAVIDAEKECNQVVNDIVQRYKCTLQCEMVITPPFPSKSRVLVVHESRLKDDRNTPESDRAERLCMDEITTVCTKYNCVGVATMKVVSSTIGVIPMFIHNARLQGYV